MSSTRGPSSATTRGTGVAGVAGGPASGRSSATRGAGRAWLVYDGECPLCNRYAEYAAVERAVGDLTLVDARHGGPLVDELMKSYDLDKGMVLKIDGRCYFGEDALRMLAALSGGRGACSKANHFLFRSRGAARLAYPLLRLGRRAALALKRVGPIAGQGRAGENTR